MRSGSLCSLCFVSGICVFVIIPSNPGPLWVTCEVSGQVGGGGGGWGEGVVPLSPRSENVSRLCSLLPFALWWNLVFSACLAMWSSYKRRRGRGRLAARICTSMRACVCVSACVWVGRAERSHSTLERGVHTSQPRGGNPAHESAKK